MTSRLPKLIAFDLDYTLWDLWVDTHVDPPIKRVGNTINELRDRHDERISFYHDVPAILHRLKEAGTVTVAACSRTHTPALARKALGLLLMPYSAGNGMSPTPAVEFFDQLEIYPGSKIRHFKELHKKTGIPYSEMLFFDDEYRNHEVEELGVTFCLVKSGVNDRTFEHGLSEWRKRHPVEVMEDASGPTGTEEGN